MISKHVKRLCTLLAIRKMQALAGRAHWIGCQPANQKVAGSIPCQGMCLGCGPGPQLVACRRHLIDVSLLLFLLHFPSL